MKLIRRILTIYFDNKEIYIVGEQLKMKWLIMFSPLIELTVTASLAKIWSDDYKEIMPIIILQFILYTVLITPLLLWGFVYR